jgi:hypothetical protein
MVVLMTGMMIQVLMQSVLTVDNQREQGLDGAELRPDRKDRDQRRKEQCSDFPRHLAFVRWTSRVQ